MEVLPSARAVPALPPLLLEMPDFMTIDGQSIPYVEGVAALRTGHALLVGGFLVAPFTFSYSVPYPRWAA